MADGSVDPLGTLLDALALRTSVFYAGALCGRHDFRREHNRGHLHVLRSGRLMIEGRQRQTIQLDQPSLVFLPCRADHAVIARDGDGSEVVCGTVEFAAGSSWMLAEILPEMIILPIDGSREMPALLSLMVAELESDRPGRQVMLDRLGEALVIAVVRDYALANPLELGFFRGVSDPLVSVALKALHAEADGEWTVERMAQVCGMSRARFAARFREAAGVTPLAYLTRLRIGRAQDLLLQGHLPKRVALDVGYSGASAFSRVFNRVTGCPPAEWVRRIRTRESAERVGQSFKTIR
jgi:AraC-like DNA-binding protein